MKIRRNLFWVWLLGVLLLLLPGVVQAQFTFTTNNSTITIMGYTGSGGNVIVPSVINGYPVKNIGIYAFSPAPGNPNPITSVVIPDTITNIGANAFVNCSRLTNAIISTNVTELAVEVFGFSGLTSFTFPSGITSIDGGAFDNCLSLTNVVIPSSVQYIGDYAFNDSYGMTSVIIPDSVTNLGDWSFSGCINITNLTIGNGITSIAPATFTSCPKLTTVSIPDSVTNIEYTYYYSAFSGCPALTNITYGSGLGTNVGSLRYSGTTNLDTITVSSNNPVLSSLNGVLFDKYQNTLLQCPIGKAGSYAIPNTVTSLGNQAFLNCSRLTDITFDSSITGIGGNIFYGCTGITNINFLGGMTNLLTGLFYSCVNLESFYVSSNNPAYSSSNGVLFNKCRTTLIQYPYNGNGNYTFPNGIISIADEAFAFCVGLTNVMLPNSLTSIGQYAFISCSNLVSIVIPENVTNMGSTAFGYCLSLNSVYFEGNAPAADDSTFIYNPPDPFGSWTLPATIYYLPGTTGWSNSFASVPTVLWNPQAQTGDASFGVQSNQFGFNITGSSNLVIVVEAATNLASPVWSPVSTNTLNTFVGTNGTSYFSDPQWTNYPGRFYRLRSP